MSTSINLDAAPKNEQEKEAVILLLRHMREASQHRATGELALKFGYSEGGLRTKRVCKDFAATL